MQQETRQGARALRLGEKARRKGGEPGRRERRENARLIAWMDVGYDQGRRRQRDRPGTPNQLARRGKSGVSQPAHAEKRMKNLERRLESHFSRRPDRRN
ncbi:hypothetical protein [Methylocystis parvus]|uniref:hypothetical protein n=1 Tax=Methylocystis parvus TaxID=134 RepID=UPI003C70D2CA